jgi:Protein of unknown function (DUF2637)
VGLLALIAGTVSYLHMHTLVGLHGQPGWVAALTPLSVDGLIVAASTTLLADSREGESGGVLPWALLVAGSAASLAANVAVAQPTAAGRVIAAWPSFALIGVYELLMRQVRRSAAGQGRRASAGARAVPLVRRQVTTEPVPWRTIRTSRRPRHLRSHAPAGVRSPTQSRGSSPTGEAPSRANLTCYGTSSQLGAHDLYDGASAA